MCAKRSARAECEFNFNYELKSKNFAFTRSRRVNLPAEPLPTSRTQSAASALTVGSIQTDIRGIQDIHKVTGSGCCDALQKNQVRVAF